MEIKHYPTFKYIDAGNALSKWERILLEDLEIYRAKSDNIDICKSVARYASSEHKDGQPMLMGLTIDLDNDDLEKVLKEARALRDYFYDEWGLKTEEVRIYYSGNRSVHIEIQPETLGIHPNEKLYLYIKEVLRAIADELELGCVDLSIYAKRHLFRCAGTKHSKTGRYKVEIDPSELNLPAGDLQKLGDTNRGSLYQDLELSENAVASQRFKGLFETAQKSIDEATYRGSSIESISMLKGMEKYPPCIQDLLDNGIIRSGTRNRATLTLACFLKDNGKTKDETIEILTQWVKAIPAGLTYTDEKTRVEQTVALVNYIFSEAGRDYRFACQFILSLGDKSFPVRCKARCQLHIGKETRKQIKSESALETTVKTAYLPKVGNLLVDLVYDPLTKTASFAVYDPQKDEVKYVKEVSDYPIIYEPYIDENVLKGNVLLPSKAEEYESDEKLCEEINNFILKYYNEPSPIYRTFNTSYVLFTWAYDRFRSWCYLQFLGRAGGGKTRGLEAIGYISYRPTLLAGGDTAPCMFRMLNTYRGTAVIDEASFTTKSEAHLAITQILNVGYKLSGTVGRCEGDDNRQVRYNVGGPKLLATRDEFYDDGLRSRCFVRRTGRDNRIRKGAKRQPFTLPEGFEEEALALRNKLLMFRFRHWNNAKLDPSLEIDGVDSRINEIVVPVLSIVDSPAFKKDIEELAKEQQVDLKQQRQSSSEGEVLKAIDEIGLHTGDIAPADIGDKINAGKKDKFISTHSVTKILKRMELSLHKYGNRWLLTNCEKNQEMLKGLFQDYDLADRAAPDAGDEAPEDNNKGGSKDTDLFLPSGGGDEVVPF